MDTAHKLCTLPYTYAMLSAAYISYVQSGMKLLFDIIVRLKTTTKTKTKT